MKRFIYVFAAALSFLLIVSCNSSVVYKESKTFDGLAWKRTDKAIFKITVENDSAPYDLLLNFRYADGFPYQFLNLEMKTTDPHGQTATTQHQFKIRNDDKSYIGDGSGDIWDFEAPIISKATLEKGTYTFEFTQLQPQETMMLTMELGIVLKKSELDVK